MDRFQVDVLFSNNRMIDVKAVINGIKVYMTFVYGDPVLERRDQVWERLTHFSTIRDGTWFMIGDFNEITGHHEKEGGRKWSDTSFLSFNQMISDYGMLEFPCTGNQLSWAGKILMAPSVVVSIVLLVMKIGMKNFYIPKFNT